MFIRHRCGTLVNHVSSTVHHVRAWKAAWWDLLPQGIAAGKAMSWSQG